MEIQAIGRDLLEAGLDGEVAVALSCVGETTDGHGRLKYSSRTSAFLARIIAARTYGPHVHQLCHLINALSAAPDGDFVSLLVGPGRLTPDRVRGHLPAPPATGAMAPDVTPGTNALALGLAAIGVLGYGAAVEDWFGIALGLDAGGPYVVDEG